MHSFFDCLLHFDTALPKLLLAYGPLVYAIVFTIIFCETGLVVTPFLPGDSMLFALGAFASQGSLSFAGLFIGLSLAAILGNMVNYAIGRLVGQKLLNIPHQKFFKKAHYERAHAYYEKHGAFAVVLSRFIPIIRSFAPFVAGVAKMSKRKFSFYNLMGGILWVGLFLGGGYYLGSIPWVRGNFKVITFAIIVVSLVPVAYEILKPKLKQ